MKNKLIATVVTLIVIVFLGGGFVVMAKQHQKRLDKQQCLNYLRSIEGAKDYWAAIYHHSTNETPTWDDLRPFLENVVWGCAGASNGEKLPHCPSGGIYTLGRIDDEVYCSIPGHTLPKWPETVITIQDATSNTILNAKVEVKDGYGNVIGAMTDSSGAARFRNWPRGALVIRVSKQGYLTNVERLIHNLPPTGSIFLAPRKTSTN